MNLFEVVQKRRSVRAFAKTPVEAEKLQLILETAILAPSAGNLQAYEIYLVKGDRERRVLVDAAWGQTFIAEAPLVLVFCANPARSAVRYRQRGTRLYAIQDATIACTFAMLAAAALGLSTVWVGAFEDTAVSSAIGAAKGLLPVAILPVGYAAEEPEPSSRRPLRELVHEV